MTPKRFFFILLGVTAALVVAGGAGYYFALQQVTQTKAVLAVQLGKQAAAQEELDATARLRVQYNREIRPILPLIEAALPRTKNQTAILAQLQAVAGASSLALEGVTFPSAAGLPGETSQTIKAGTILALPVNFQLTGTYPQLQAFLTRVENLNRFTSVSTLTVTRTETSGTVVYRMTINAYVKP